MRAGVAWSVTLPVLLVGELAGHSLAYRVVAPDADRRAALLARTGHQYLTFVHPAVGLCLAVAAAALVARAGAVLGGRARGQVPSWRLAALPAAAFLLQEYAERCVHAGHLEWGTVAEPAVAIGVVLQLPCGVLALWLVRALLRLADSAGRALGSVRGATVRARFDGALASAAIVEPLRLVPLARGSAERGPPPLFA